MVGATTVGNMIYSLSYPWFEDWLLVATLRSSLVVARDS